MNHCKKKIRLESSSRRPILNTILLALLVILPKCPFCIMAYTGAVTLCSGSKFAMHLPNWASYLLLLFGALVIVGLVLNFRDRRTYIAILLAVLGMFFVVGSQWIWLSESTYYFGVILLFLGIWTNGSLFYVLTRTFKYIRIKIIDQLNFIYDS